MAKWEETEDVEGDRKTFVPLENNPEVFTALLHKLGVAPTLGFYDILSLDDQDLLAFIPRPCFAVLATIPAEAYAAARAVDSAVDMPIYDGSGASEPVIWFRQTIGHACGTIGALHAVSNGGAKAFITPDSDLDKLLKAAVPLKPKDRASLLYNSAELEAAHSTAAQMGDSVAPLPSEENYNHFIAFVRGDDGHLWELEGGVDGPIDRGVLGEADDALSEKALQLGIRPFLEKATSAANETINFSVVALAPALD
ncbi:ubiquitin C-terminal hydrolase L3 [Rhizodiscina lignyota]|uniref:Ubiquitin carboxyl-terminal hydrolase n=1 Tax=Rhizodiscina lignyota TaxID=1504668 RepID=A0A9P4ING8_9PEZI|nr:ubiquitin C-terminal hydrolase L3 [Rhizodiscina lignyota]